MKIIKVTENNKDMTLKKEKDRGLFLSSENINKDGFFLEFMDKEEFINTKIRPDRNRCLSETDFLLLPDMIEKMTKDEIADIKKYRQELRDIPQNITTDNITWPDKPKIGNFYK